MRSLRQTPLRDALIKEIEEFFKQAFDLIEKAKGDAQ